MLTEYLSKGIDLDFSYVIGDRLSDLELAKNIGSKAIYISKENSPDAELCTTDWNDIYRFLKKIPRIARVERKTNETRDQC